MTAWQDVEQAEPEFAQRVQALFDARRHKTIATVRADGSPLAVLFTARWVEPAWRWRSPRCARRKTPNQALQQTGHANDRSSSRYDRRLRTIEPITEPSACSPLGLFRI